MLVVWQKWWNLSISNPYFCLVADGHESKDVIEFLCEKIIVFVDIYRHLLNVYGDQRVNRKTAKQLVKRFSRGDTQLSNLRNEKCIDQLIHKNWADKIGTIRTVFSWQQQRHCCIGIVGCFCWNRFYEHDM